MTHAAIKLFEEIRDLFHVEIEKNPDGSFKTVNIEGFDYLVIADEGHKQEGSKIRHAVKRFFKENYPSLYESVEKHTGDTFYKATHRTPPLIVYMMAAGQITPEDYAQKILDAPANAEVVANYIENEKFVDTLYKAYDFWDKEATSVTVTPDGFKFVLPDGDKLKMLDALMDSMSVPKLADIKKQFDGLTRELTKVDAYKKDAESLASALKKAEKEFAKKLSDLSSKMLSKPFEAVETKGDGSIPNGKMVMKSAREVFDMPLKFEVPVWEWDHPHPDVPTVDADYIFREDLLTRALYAIISNQRMYLQGDTGSGKTTLVEQIAARLNWPFGRINFDSEITRMDLIGRDTMREGKTEFVDGFLPKFMSGPYILCFDEIDFVRPDVAYVMQAALEGNGLVITEDGGRRVQPHPMMRMFGTGNTVGQGDEKGMYQGARPQSLAFLDRFTIWAKVPYLTAPNRKKLLQSRVPTLTEEEVNTIIKYSDEHLTAFDQSKVLQPISPRGIVAIGHALSFNNMVNPGKKDNLQEALYTVVLDRATQADYATLKGIVDRVVRG